MSSKKWLPMGEAADDCVIRNPKWVELLTALSVTDPAAVNVPKFPSSYSNNHISDKSRLTFIRKGLFDALFTIELGLLIISVSTPPTFL